MLVYKLSCLTKYNVNVERPYALKNYIVIVNLVMINNRQKNCP